MAKQTITLGEQLVLLLESYDTKLVFGIPGVHTIELYRGLKASSIRHITPRHEQGAGFMADGYARATGKVGVCLCITGPGMTNIATPMGQAYADSIPMLVLSSVNKTDTLGLGKGRLHELKNQQSLVSGVSAFSHTLLSANELPAVIARAFAVFTSSRPRPVHIEIPIDLMTELVDKKLPPPRALPQRPGPDTQTVNAIVQHLANAKKAIVLAGGGCIDAQAQLNRFVDLVGLPTCLTINARGLLDQHHPLLLDGVQTIQAFRDYVADCDVCIAIGTELGETDYDFYDAGPLQTRGEFIRIDIDPSQLSNNAATTIGLVSDAGKALSALCDSIERRSDFKPQQNASNTVQSINSALRDSFIAASNQYELLLDNIKQAFPNAIIVGDSTKPIYHANFVHRSPAPRHWFNSATGFGTLGYALPAAIGAKLGQPDLPVVAIAGDGGFQFTLNELVSAKQAGVGIAIIVWNNNSYREINDFMVRNQIEPVGVDAVGPQLELLAQAMGAHYAKASAVNDIHTLLKPLMSLSAPLLIEYVADVDA